jgi:pyruvate dehydrogenase E2 component (dihydrolipoamide acetyltransferase)
VQSIVGFLGKPGEAIPEVTAPAPVKSEPPPAAARVASAPVSSPAVAAAAPASAPVVALAAAPILFRISPRAAALARDCVIDPSGIKGSGPGGRVVEKNVKAYLEARGYHRLRVSPLAMQLAAKEKLDLLAIQDMVESGRISVADVERAAAEKPRPMSKMRQIIAQRLAQSMATAPHFYVTAEVDMTDLVGYRARLKEQGAQYTITDFISRAAVLTLKEFPEVNSSTDGKTIRWSSRVHLGLAVALEQGLVVPVIRNADELTLGELNARSKELSEKARAGKLAPDEMTGSTFTISNMGMLDVENFTAIINPGESAILAVSSVLKKPVVRDDEVVVRSIMKMTLSSDHRLVDGATAARFVNALKKKIEDGELWRSLTS